MAPRPRRSLGCALTEPRVAVVISGAYITDAMSYLWDGLAKLAPGSQCGGVYANKPGYHNTRAQNAPGNYSVVDAEDRAGPPDKAAAIDWTFPEAQSGDYSRISVYTQRLLTSARDPADPRLDGWREFYGNADWDTYVEGYDCRYNVDASSDSSHLWHLHLSEDRDKVDSFENKDNLLSVLRGESVQEWDMTAKDVWDYDIDPSGAKYSAGGAQKVTLDRTGYLANEFAPAVTAQLADLADQLEILQTQRTAPDPAGLRRALGLLTVLIMLAAIVAAIGLGMILAQS
jgi:hypothetical protein